MKLPTPFSFPLLGLGLCSGVLGRQDLPSRLLPVHERHQERPQIPIASPAPTAPPKANIELLRRAEGDSICGYISGVKTYASAIDCGVDWACIPEPGGKHFGCSKSGEGSFFETACFGRNELTTNTDEYRTLWCNWNTNLPYCATGIYTDGVYSGYTNVFCDNVGGYYPLSHSPSQVTQTLTQTPSVATVTKEGETKIVTQSAETKTVVQTAANTKAEEEEEDASPTETAVQGGGGGAGRGGGSGASSGGDEDSSKDTSSGTLDSEAPTATDKGSTSSFPVAAVVGGAVGGIAVIGLLALAFFIVIRRGKQKHDDKTPPAMTDAGTFSQQRHSIYPTGLEVAHLPPKPSSTPPSSTASPQPNEHGSRTSTILLSPSSASPVQQQRESYSPTMHHVQQQHPGAFPHVAHPQQPPTTYSIFPDPRASQHVELPVYTQPHGPMPAQPQTMPMSYAPQTTYVVHSVAEMPVERGDRELRELGQYR